MKTLYNPLFLALPVLHCPLLAKGREKTQREGGRGRERISWKKMFSGDKAKQRESERERNDQIDDKCQAKQGRQQGGFRYYWLQGRVGKGSLIF